MIDSSTLKAWFFREVLPLEPALMRFLRRNWRNSAELVDLRQDIYARIYDARVRNCRCRPRRFSLPRLVTISSIEPGARESSRSSWWRISRP